MIEIMNKEALVLLTKHLGEIPDKLQGRGRLRKVLESVRDNVIIPSYYEQFEAGGKPPWEPLSPNTAMYGRKQNKGITVSFEDTSFTSVGHLKPLTDRGRFARSARAKARFNVRDNKLTYGDFPSSQWWWSIHDQGLAENTWPYIPRRDWSMRWASNKADVNTVIDITWDYVKDAIDSSLTRRIYR